MDESSWIVIWTILFMLFIVFSDEKKKKKRTLQKIKYKHKKVDKGVFIMTEIIKKFVGQECIINTLDTSIIGIIEEITDNWIVINHTEPKNGGHELINIEFVSRIREYPRDEKGNKRKIWW